MICTSHTVEHCTFIAELKFDGPGWTAQEIQKLRHYICTSQVEKVGFQRHGADPIVIAHIIYYGKEHEKKYNRAVVA